MAGRHRVPLRAFLWEYLGYPEGETAERRRILYAIVVLRLGFGLFFLLRGWGAIFGASAGELAVRLGDPARLGLSGAATDTTFFILGCTELGIGALLLFGAFTRVSAVTGCLLLLLYLALGDRDSFATRGDVAFGGVSALVAPLSVIYGAGLVLLVIAGSPFLSADRALDKLEEEERDRAPAVLPKLAERSALILRAGVVVAGLWVAVQYPPIRPAFESGGVNIPAMIGLLVLVCTAILPFVAVLAAIGLLAWSISLGDFVVLVLALPLPFVATAFFLAAQLPRGSARQTTEGVRAQQT